MPDSNRRAGPGWYYLHAFAFGFPLRLSRSHATVTHAPYTALFISGAATHDFHALVGSMEPRRTPTTSLALSLSPPLNRDAPEFTQSPSQAGRPLASASKGRPNHCGPGGEVTGGAAGWVDTEPACRSHSRIGVFPGLPI